MRYKGDPQKLKKLQTRLSESKAILQDLFDEKHNVEKAIKKEKNNLAGVEKDIDKLKNKNIVISEHAMLRYLEKKYKIDLKGIEDELLDEKTMNLISELGNGKYPSVDSLLIVKNNTVVTIE